MKISFLWLAMPTLCGATLAAGPGLAAPPASSMTVASPKMAAASFRVEGVVGKAQVWTVARLKREFAAQVRTVRYVLHGHTGSAQCLPLLAVLQASQPRCNSRRKSAMLSVVALVRAHDGYTVAFGMGELLPQNGAKAVWIALDANGKPLTGKDGPVRLIVPGEQKPERWVYGVSSITMVDLAPNGNLPPNPHGEHHMAQEHA